jgi:hypothetical protein
MAEDLFAHVRHFLSASGFGFAFEIEWEALVAWREMDICISLMPWKGDSDMVWIGSSSDDADD